MVPDEDRRHDCKRDVYKRQTLYNAFEMDGPVLVNSMTDPNALAMPPKIEFGQMVGFAQSMYKLLINGRSQEVIDTINSNYKHIREVF